MTTASWTTRGLLAWMTERFEAVEPEAPRRVAEMLLAHVIGCDRIRLYMEADRPATPDERERLRLLVRRALDHEPVQYLVGRASFYGTEFAVDGSTLIPQPCTEGLVERALAHLDALPADCVPRVADVATGTGNVAITIARLRPRATVVATDVAEAALDLARRNAAEQGVAERVELRAGDLLAPLAAERFDVLLANPPYVPDHEWEGGLVQPAVMKWIPERATRGGADGLRFVAPIVAGAAAHLAPGGLLAIEIAACTRDAVLALAERAPGLVEPRIERDDEGHDRFLVARGS